MIVTYLIGYLICCIISWSYLRSVIDASFSIRCLLTINFALILTPIAIIRSIRKIKHMLS